MVHGGASRHCIRYNPLKRHRPHALRGGLGVVERLADDVVRFNQPLFAIILLDGSGPRSRVVAYMQPVRRRKGAGAMRESSLFVTHWRL